ncbi:SUMO-activating enzyme subunit 1A [Apostasia shenzhenica]|uniref:Ubiquitin-like 1-activating enzyme E1A n=1 Tax=Apostasia shenzhenica TaxID=1088818 RepID=A0A2I0AIY6_9ASPA|nr:SUMO-activating enzyme subunit 1A [Apostasia shenzhenica]
MDGEELTAQQTALYDRQIRVWGVDAQKRLSKANVLVSGLNGTLAEFCKNVVLAGVGSLTLMDDRLVSDDDLRSNFLIPPDEAKKSGGSLAEVYCNSLKEFNPMVHVSVEKGNLTQFHGDLFDKFDAVVVSCCTLKEKRMINEKCRERDRRIAFYTVECRDSCGEIFVDLQNYTYAQKKSDDNVKYHLEYPSFQEAISVPWRDLPRKTTKTYFAMRVLEHFEYFHNRKYGETSASDLPIVLNLRKTLCDEQGVNESLIPEKLLDHLLSAGAKEHPPVCAILGGILGQEVIKAISGKGDPLKNFFYFDAADGKGIIEDISPVSKH